MIDQYGDYWLEVNYLDDNGEPAFNTLKLETGTYSLIEADTYEVLSE